MKILKVIIAVLLFSILAFVLINMAARELGTPGIPWGDVAVPHLVLWAAFLGAILATFENRHIAIEVLPKLLPGRLHLWNLSFNRIVTVVICGFLTWGAWNFIEQEKMFGETLFLGIVSWQAALVVPITFGAIAVINVWFLVTGRKY